MHEWFDIVRAGDISNDNLPFVTLVHGVCFLSAYLAAWSIYRWHNAWIAVLPAGVVLLTNISGLRGQPSGAFVVFLFGAILLVGRIHLQRNQLAWKRQGVEYPDWISLSAAQLTVLMTLGLIIAAWMVPLGSQADAVNGTLDFVAKPVTGQSGTFCAFHNVTSQGREASQSRHSKSGQHQSSAPEAAEVNASPAGLVRATS
jgi:hypothetical protein